MTILEAEVTVIINGRTVKNFEELGYDIPKVKGQNNKYSIPKGTKLNVKVTDLMINSSQLLTKICDKCGKESNKKQPYHSILKYRENGDGKDRCFKCGNEKRALDKKNNVRYENSLEYYAKINNKQYLINEFSDKNTKKPNEISKSNSDFYWWNCSDCGSEYDMRVSNRTNGNQNCPYCRGARVNATNCLATINPDLAKEWHPTKNETLTPNDLTVSSAKIVWWKCSKCDSDYDMRMYDRNNNHNCPYCKGFRVNHTNSFASRNPDKINEWNYKRNGSITPEDVTYGSKKKIWWICDKGHEWIATPNDRSSDYNCPKCKSSKGEVKINNILEKNNIKFEYNYKFGDCKNKNKLPFDFYIDNKIIIEYDGEVHFNPIRYTKNKNKTDDALKYRQNNDKIKNQYCVINKIPLIRIPYWEFSNIEYIVENVLKHYNLIESDNTYDKEIVLRYLVNNNWDHDTYIKSNKNN